MMVGSDSKPWLKHYGQVPESLEDKYPKGTLYDVISAVTENYPDNKAYDFMGKKVKYKKFIEDIDRIAVCLRNIGVRKGDKVLICMPNCPHALHVFYGANRIGAVCVMVHPLSSKNEIEFYLNNSKSRFAVTIDRFFSSFEGLDKTTCMEKLIVSDISMSLGFFTKWAYKFSSRKVKKVIPSDAVMLWNDFVMQYDGTTIKEKESTDKDLAVILYTGGTTGTSKGVMLSNRNMNASALQTFTMGQYANAELSSMLAVLPIFHGFGLCVGVHMAMMFAMKVILIPAFSPESFAKLIKKKKPNYVAGVPTLYELMLRNPIMKNADLSSLKGIFVGGDTMSVNLKKRLDEFLSEHGSSAIAREGYGLTEVVTASCLTPLHEYRPGSIGIPFSDTLYKVVSPGTMDEVPFRTDGEICISGPAVMMGYIDAPEETAAVLKVHADGRTWLHTGDAGMMDEDGFIYFKQRIKRMIVTSGYNIYPSHIEETLDKHPAVLRSCVIAIHDDIKAQVPKAYVMLKPEFMPSDELKKELKAFCIENMARYSIPRSFEFIDKIPMTKVGKVAYTELEEMEKAKNG